jgi:hypothetical protein
MTRRKIQDANLYVRPEHLRFRGKVPTRTLAESVCCVVPPGDCEYLGLEGMLDAGFVVIDKETGYKAVCEHNAVEVEQIELMVQSYFNARAVRVGGRLWMA